jgi:hypothetical protein
MLFHIVLQAIHTLAENIIKKYIQYIFLWVEKYL